MHLRTILRGAHAFLTPQAALAGLPVHLAADRPSTTSHSILEIVAHMAFWQDWFLDRCDGIATPLPATAAAGWPLVEARDWETVLDRFTRGFERASRLADDAARVAAPISPALESKPLASYTIADAITHLALHNAHHAGQVIILRQQLGTWPPPAGSWSW